MSPLVLLVGSIAGIALLALVSYALGGLKTARVGSREEVVARLAALDEGFRPGEMVMAANGDVALVAEEGGDRVGLVAAVGDAFAVRLLASGDVKHARLQRRGGSGASMRLQLHDFTLPVVRFWLDGGDDPPHDWRHWEDRLNALKPRRR